MKVNAYVVNALKGLGLRDVRTGQELEIQEIEQQLARNNFDVVRAGLREELLYQMRQDSQNQRVYQEKFKFDFTAVKQILLQNQIFRDPHDCDRVLGTVAGASADNVVDVLLGGVVQGLPEQRGIKPEQAEQAADSITKIVEGDYRQFLAQRNLSEDKFSLSQYKAYQTKNLIIDQFTKLVGNQAKAMQLLNHPIKSDDPILANNDSLRSAYETAQQQLNQETAVLGGQQHNQITMLDLLMGVSQASTRAQVMAYCENRAMEQRQEFALDSPLQLGNVLGKSGRQAIEADIDGHISDKIMAVPHASDKVSLPEKKWRGYKVLAAKMELLLKKMHATIPAMIFVNRLLAKEQVNGKAIDEKYRWQEWGEMQDMPANYRDAQGNLNQAGEYYNRAQARLIADRVRVIEYETKIKNDPKNKNPELRSKLVYYQARVNATQHALAELKYNIENSNQVPDDAFFRHLTTNIVYLQGSELGQNQEFMQSPEIQQEIQKTRATNPAAQMTGALKTFANFEQSQDANEKQASYVMLSELFSIRDKFDAGNVTTADLDDLMNHIPNSPFNPKMVNALVDGLNKQPGEQGYISPADCLTKLNQASQKYLQEHKYRKTFYNHQLSEQSVVEQTQNM